MNVSWTFKPIVLWKLSMENSMSHFSLNIVQQRGYKNYEKAKSIIKTYVIQNSV